MFCSSDNFLLTYVCQFFFQFVKKLPKFATQILNSQTEISEILVNGSSFFFLFRVCGLLKIRSRNSFQANYKNDSFLIFFFSCEDITGSDIKIPLQEQK